ncbi:MAG: Hsp70 family protein [Candidatus Gracilibacteria bacterium]|nr:Hsp70 family protein [Candidatus Gracilibacteria bacterium]
MNKFAGIDFGTTNTSIGYIENKGEAKLINLLNGAKTDRTCIFYSFDEDGIGIVGQKGFDDSIMGERGRLITSPKKFLKNNEMPEIQILREKYDLTDIISHIIINFKKKLEIEAGEEIDSILVGRPVRFHDTDDELNNLAENRLKTAFKKAGFKNIEFQLEPIGAFNAYKNNHPELTESNNKVLVVDLGGGTSDFSLIETSRNGIDILGNTGVYVGGDNIDEKLILNYFGNYLGKGAKQKLINGGVSFKKYRWLL